eukprot:TRINITY_DN1084_c0_g1_i3.p1 TRINITY_DN1084_c0_g1~~TRINITY_DN1084_c0_g1_i3.p1  ORF type:complete len:172 (+),score=27.10 TRINITY_DN1084_c0_g1_i3:35-550(+)
MASARVDFKLVLLGKGGVGKTCLVRRYLDGVFHLEEASTVGAAYFSKKILVGSSPIVLGIWDTAGQERFDSMTKIYYRGAEAAIVCYDLTDKNSFERARFWVDELLMNVENCRIYLVGTKADLVDEFGRGKPADDIAHFARSIDATLNIETSSKTGKAVCAVKYGGVGVKW